MKLARNAFKGYTYQNYIFTLLLAIMDTERCVKRIICEATDTKNFDDAYVETIDGKSYRLQVKNYGKVSLKDISVDSKRNTVISLGKESEYDPADNNVFIVNATFDGICSPNHSFLGLPAVELEGILIVPLSAEHIDELIDDLFQQENRELQIIYYGYKFTCTGKFDVCIEDLPNVVTLSMNLNQETIMVRGVRHEIQEGITYIVGKPGVGKSHYVNELKEAIPESIVYRFWTGQQDPKRVERLQFSTFMEQIGLCAFQSPRAFTRDELINCLIQNNKVLIIDGLDHVENYNSLELQKYIDFINMLGEHRVHVVVLSRPMRLEPWTEKIELSNWNFDETALYLAMAYDITSYSTQKQLYSVSNGYPIITFFLAEHYKCYGELNLNTSIAGIDEYYEALLVGTNLKSLLSVFTVNNSFLTKAELNRFFSKEYYTAVSEFIASFPYLFDVVENRVALIHDSFNTYLRNQLQGNELWKSKVLPFVRTSLLKGEIEYLARFSSFEFEEDTISAILKKYSDFDAFENLLKSTVDYDSISMFYDQLRLVLDTHPNVLDISQYYAFSLIFQAVTRNDLIGNEGLIYQILVYVSKTDRIENLIFSSGQIWNVYLACINKLGYMEKYLKDAHYESNQVNAAIESINKEITFYDILTSEEDGEDILPELDRRELTYIDKTDLLARYLVLIWIHNETDALFFSEFKDYVENDKEERLHWAIQSKYHIDDDFWVRGAYYRARYKLHELGFFGEKNQFRGNTMQGIIQTVAPEGSFNVTDATLSFLRLANYEKRTVDIYCINYVWSMYGQRKDYSVYTIPIALITFENKGLIQEKESIEIINHLLKQSEKGISHLLTSYINQKGPKCVHRLVESGRILDSSLELDVFQLNPECINELPTKAIEKRVFNLLRYHFQSKVVDGSYICNVLHSKYAKYLCSQLASFHMQIMNSLSDKEIEIVRSEGIEYIPNSNDVANGEYEPFRHGYISRDDYEYIKQKGMSALDCSRYTDGWYTCLPFVDLYELFNIDEIRDQHLAILHRSLFAKVLDNEHFGNWYCIIGNIPAFLDKYGITVDWKQLFVTMLRFLDISVIYYPPELMPITDS